MENPSSFPRCSGTHGLHKLVRYINEHKLYPENDKGTRVRESLVHELCIANTTRYSVGTLFPWTPFCCKIFLYGNSRRWRILYRTLNDNAIWYAFIRCLIQTCCIIYFAIENVQFISSIQSRDALIDMLYNIIIQIRYFYIKLCNFCFISYEKIIRVFSREYKTNFILERNPYFIHFVLKPNKQNRVRYNIRGHQLRHFPH